MLSLQKTQYISEISCMIFCDCTHHCNKACTKQSTYMYSCSYYWTTSWDEPPWTKSCCYPHVSNNLSRHFFHYVSPAILPSQNSLPTWPEDVQRPQSQCLHWRLKLVHCKDSFWFSLIFSKSSLHVPKRVCGTSQHSLSREFWGIHFKIALLIQTETHRYSLSYVWYTQGTISNSSSSTSWEAAGWPAKTTCGEIFTT